MHTMQTHYLVAIGSDECSGAALKGTGELIEPPHLASGEASSPRRYLLLCLL